MMIDPLRPPPDSGPTGRLAAVISTSATWFFAAPVTDRDKPPIEHGVRTLADVEETVVVAHDLLCSTGVSVEIQASEKVFAQDRRGYLLVDLFCNRHLRNEGNFSCVLRSGRTVNQRQLLSAMALYQCEQTARAVASGDARGVCDLMEDVLELVCEVRRAMDREAGSSVAARRARQRHEGHDRIKRKAYELYAQQEWKSARKAAQTLFKKVHAFSVEINEPLSTDSGELTLLCKWLRSYRNSMRAQQA
jgi:hypothetical protein